jgi:hypothetical protein
MLLFTAVEPRDCLMHYMVAKQRNSGKERQSLLHYTRTGYDHLPARLKKTYFILKETGDMTFSKL